MIDLDNAQRDYDTADLPGRRAFVEYERERYGNPFRGLVLASAVTLGLLTAAVVLWEVLR